MCKPTKHVLKHKQPSNVFKIQTFYRKVRFCILWSTNRTITCGKECPRFRVRGAATRHGGTEEQKTVTTDIGVITSGLNYLVLREIEGIFFTHVFGLHN